MLHSQTNCERLTLYKAFHFHYVANVKGYSISVLFIYVIFELVSVAVVVVVAVVAAVVVAVTHNIFSFGQQFVGISYYVRFAHEYTINAFSHQAATPPGQIEPVSIWNWLNFVFE